MDVLVIGGTGFIGTALCEELVDRGHEVTALSRNAETADLPEGVEPSDGDVTDYESVEGAFEGQDAAVNLVALSPVFKPKGGNEMHERIHYGGTENALRAAREHDVERFVQMSAAGADPESPTAYLRAKGRAEQLVRESDRDWAVFRPSIVFGDGGEFTSFTLSVTTPYLTGLPGGGRTRFQPIWLGDIVPMLADAVEDDAHVGEVYEVGGPEVLSLADVARLAHRSKGRPLTVLPLPMPLAKVGMSIMDPVPVVPFHREQYKFLRMDHSIPDNDVDAFGVDPADLRTFREYLGLDRPA
jgi:NADH dehydrogenase